jgi:hypothetical protein
MRPMATISVLMFLTLIAHPTLLQSQETQQMRLVELSGSLAYSFNSESYDFQYPGGFDPYDYTHTISIEPSIGYFFTKHLELNVSLTYSAILMYWNGYKLVGSTVSEEAYRQWNHRMGFLAGPTYNYSVNEIATLFARVAVGFMWLKVGSDSPGRAYTPAWTRPSVTLPQVVIGMKIRISPDWQLETYGQYLHISNDSGNAEWVSNQIAIGVGFAVLL